MTSADTQSCTAKMAQPNVPSTRLATHADGTPMISIGHAAPLDQIAAQAADPEHSRAVLAQLEPKVGPTDEELDAMERQCYVATEVCNDSGCEYVFEHRRFARAAIAADRARWGRPAPAPAWEVAALSISLRHCGDALRAYGLAGSASECDRAADLLERQAVPVPVAVSERWPSHADLGTDGAIWFRHTDKQGETHWLPDRAIPLPGNTESGGCND